MGDAIIVELKATQDSPDAFAAQCLTYLKATGLPLCLLLNVGKPRVEIKRYRRYSVFIRVYLWPNPHEPPNPQRRCAVLVKRYRINCDIDFSTDPNWTAPLFKIGDLVARKITTYDE